MVRTEAAPSFHRGNSCAQVSTVVRTLIVPISSSLSGIYRCFPPSICVSTAAAGFTIFSDDDDICAFREFLCDRYELLLVLKKYFERKLDTIILRFLDRVMKVLYNGRLAQIVEEQASMPDHRMMFTSASIKCQSGWL